MRAHAAVFAGGALGALGRYGLNEAFTRGDAGAWPWATFAANVIGCLLLGYFAVRLGQGEDDLRRPLLMAGFCGALTTFSTFQLELIELPAATAVAYAAASIAAGLLAVTAGRRAAAWR